MSRGPKPSQKIAFNADELNRLKHISRLRQAPYAQVVRARILLMAFEHPDWNNAAIAHAVGCAYATVRKWRSRWPMTSSIEEGERGGRPRFFRPPR